MKKSKYKFMVGFLIIGWILSVIIFFNSSSLTFYGEAIIISTFVFGSIGWMVDKFILKQPLIPIILIIIYLLIGGYYFYQETNKVTCLACNFASYENIFTGNCRTLCDICGHSPPWYLKKSERCVPDIPF